MGTHRHDRVRCGGRAVRHRSDCRGAARCGRGGGRRFHRGIFRCGRPTRPSALPRLRDGCGLSRLALLPRSIRASVVRICLHARALTHLRALSHHDARLLRWYHRRCSDGGDRVLGRNDRGLRALASWGGFKNRALTVVATTALYGAATLGVGMLGAVGFLLFLVASFLMGLSSPFYSGPQTALMQEKIPPEFLGRVFGLYGAIMSWALPLGLAGS